MGHLEGMKGRQVDVLWNAPGINLGAPEIVGRFRRALHLSLPKDAVAANRSRLLSGRSSIVYDLLYDGYDATLVRWRTKLRSDGLNGTPAPAPIWLTHIEEGTL